MVVTEGKRVVQGGGSYRGSDSEYMATEGVRTFSGKHTMQYTDDTELYT